MNSKLLFFPAATLLLASACGGTGPASHPEEGAVQNQSQGAEGTGRPPIEAHPRMDGTCTIAAGEQREVHTYAEGKLLRTTRSLDHMDTSYVYEGGRLVRMEQDLGREAHATARLRYEEGRLSEVEIVATLPSSEERRVIERLRFLYDADGRLTRYEDHDLREGAGDAALRFEVLYNERGQVRELSPVEGTDESLRMSAEHDAEGRLISATLPEGVSWRYEYGADGYRSAQVLTARGETQATVTLRYDAEGRLIARASPEMGEGAEEVTYEGTFGPGAICGDVAPPPGIPDSPLIQWRRF